MPPQFKEMTMKIINTEKRVIKSWCNNPEELEEFCNGLVRDGIIDVEEEQ